MARKSAAELNTVPHAALAPKRAAKAELSDRPNFCAEETLACQLLYSGLNSANAMAGMGFAILRAPPLGLYDFFIPF